MVICFKCKGEKVIFELFRWGDRSWTQPRKCPVCKGRGEITKTQFEQSSPNLTGHFGCATIFVLWLVFVAIYYNYC